MREFPQQCVVCRWEADPRHFTLAPSGLDEGTRLATSEGQTRRSAPRNSRARERRLVGRGTSGRLGDLRGAVVAARCRPHGSSAPRATSPARTPQRSAPRRRRASAQPSVMLKNERERNWVRRWTPSHARMRFRDSRDLDWCDDARAPLPEEKPVPEILWCRPSEFPGFCHNYCQQDVST